MGNPFDVFDAPSPAAASRQPNPFDVFDGPTAAAPTSAAPRGGAPGALQIRVGTKPASMVPNPFGAGQIAPGAIDQTAFDSRFYGDGGGLPPMAADVDARSPLAKPLQARAAGIQANEDAALVGAPSTGNDILTAALNAGQGASLNVMGNAAAGVATGLGALGVPGYSPRSFSENYSRFKGIMGAHERQSPKSAIAGTIGGALAGIPLMPGLAGAPAAGFGARVLQNAATGAGYGFAGEYLDSKDTGSAAKAGTVGGVLGGTLGAAIEKAAPSLMKGSDLALRKLGLRAAPVPRTTFNPDEVAAIQAAGADPAQLSDNQTARFLDAFKAKGVSPAVVREAQAAEFGIPLSRGQATGDARDIALEQGAIAGRKGQKAQEIGQEFEASQAGARLSAREALMSIFAGNRPTIDNPAAAAEGVADAARRIRDDNAFRASAAQRQADQALEAVRGRGLPPDPIDTANVVGQSLRDAANDGRAAYRSAYDDVAQIPGQFTPGALDRMGTRVRDRLGAEYPIDPVLTPAANRAIGDLDSLPGIFGLEPGQGPNLQQVDQLRKRLVAYRGSTGQNPTDRRAMDKLLREFDGHIEDAMSVGQFGQQVPSRAPAPPVDDFPGFALSGIADPAAAAPGASQAASRGRQSQPESLLDYLYRPGVGIPNDAEARAADLHKLYRPGRGTLARQDAPSWDDLRVRLTEEGFLSPDEMGAASARDVADKVRDLIHADRVGGRKTYRLEDEGRAAGTRRNVDRVSDENADHLAQVDRQARRIAIDMEAHGLRPKDLDQEALNDAAAMMLRGEADDAAHAYDRAVMQRSEGDLSRPAPASRIDDAPFPALGEGFAPTSDLSAGGLPIGDTTPALAMRRARGLFRDYKQSFSPRGPGDDAGIAMRKIVDRDATPNEIASALYGGTKAGTTGLSVRIHDRLRETLPEGHPAFAAIQQGLISKVVDGGSGDVAARLDHLLNGEGRTLAAKVLTPEQRAGLEAFRAGSVQARNASEALPDWVRRLADTGFDPNRVTADLFGSGIPGARPGQPAFAKGLKSFLGSDSPEWSNLRQAAWLRLVQHGEGTPISPTKEAARIRAFTEGEGKGMATVMFSPTELASMNRYADAVRITELPKGQRLPDGGKATALAGHALNLIAGTIGFKLAGPAGGAAAYGAKVGQKALQGGLTAARASRSFGEGAPRVMPPLPSYAPLAGARAAVGGGITADDLIRGRR